MNKDIVYNKIETINRCINRINEVYSNNPENLNNFTKQDSIVLNIQRACEATIDLAMHIVAENRLGIPQRSRDAFDFLYNNNLIDEQMNERLKAMVGFRNLAVHDYKEININILQKIIENHLDDFISFSNKVLQLI